MEHIQIDWNMLQDKEEIEIIQKYAKIARRFMYIFVGRIINKKYKLYEIDILVLSINNFYS